jgi:hypothetical protein
LRRTATIVTAALLVAMIVAAAAFAAEVSREEYTASAEPICHKSAQENERILANARKELKAGKLKPVAAKFAKASKVQARALKELEALPQPAADQARLGKWLGYLKQEAALFASAGKKLQAGNKAQAERDTSKIAGVANKANNEVLPFEFRYCRQEPSKYT